MRKAEQLLACTLTYRSAEIRKTPLDAAYPTQKAALDVWFSVLMHEAHEAMTSPLNDAPMCTYLHPVDVDTLEPGIVDGKENGHVLRCSPDLPRVAYATPPRIDHEGPTHSIVNETDIERARQNAQKTLEKDLKRAEKRAGTSSRREQRAKEQKEARRQETQEARELRLVEARQKRQERAQQRTIPSQTQHTIPPETSQETDEHNDDSILVPDLSLGSVLCPLKKRRRGDKLQYFQHPLPHHRHLLGLQLCQPNESLLPTLLHGAENENVEIIQGPPGTGKTRELVRLIPTAEGRVFLCAPTNVGAVNLYNRCIAEGLADDTALLLAANRVPPGTVVLSNDPKRRIVCATISARSGPSLINERFENVFVDEAAQCMEAWTWTLFRKEVRRIALAGDTQQLPACVSETGRDLNHHRSLMERLVADLKYTNVVTLNIQNRMAPELLTFPNKVFYKDALVCGAHAPSSGTVEIIWVEADEEAVGSSFRNQREAAAVAQHARDNEHCVIITPYSAQVQLLLSHALQREVHTVDSFQGREADTIVLSTVRDGTTGLGFWSDDRRLTVALTRARRRLIVVVSATRWPKDNLLYQFVNTQR